MLTVAPTFDPESGLWLSDGWPVPDPGATFDRNAPWMSAEEAARLLVECVRGKGWDVTVDGPTGFGTTVPPGQKSAYDNDVKGCYVTHRIGIDPGPPHSKELAQREYAAQVSTRECLTRLVKDLPELPSYQMFADALFTEDFIISIYGLAADEGIDLFTDPTIWQQCPDSTINWGHN